LEFGRGVVVECRIGHFDEQQHVSRAGVPVFVVFFRSDRDGHIRFRFTVGTGDGQLNPECGGTGDEREQAVQQPGDGGSMGRVHAGLLHDQAVNQFAPVLFFDDAEFEESVVLSHREPLRRPWRR
jgi:hypothetical protein